MRLYTDWDHCRCIDLGSTDILCKIVQRKKDATTCGVCGLALSELFWICEFAAPDREGLPPENAT
jgi:hypothetical protein